MRLHVMRSNSHTFMHVRATIPCCIGHGHNMYYTLWQSRVATASHTWLRSGGCRASAHGWPQGTASTESIYMLCMHAGALIYSLHVSLCTLWQYCMAIMCGTPLLSKCSCQALIHAVTGFRPRCHVIRDTSPSCAQQQLQQACWWATRCKTATPTSRPT
jgi:hypothetical protein